MSDKVRGAASGSHFVADGAPYRFYAVTLDECERTCGSGYSCVQSDPQRADAGFECVAQSGSSLLFVSTALSIVFGLILIQLALFIVLRVCVCRMRRRARKDKAAGQPASAYPQQVNAQVGAALLFRQGSKLIVPEGCDAERSEKTESYDE